MKNVIRYTIIALVLAAAGFVLWRAGRVEQRLASVQTQLATLSYEAAEAEGIDIEDAASRTLVPWVDTQAAADGRRHRTSAAYWLEKYNELRPPRDASGALLEQDAEVLLVGANAAYRQSLRQSSDRQTTVRRLEEVIASYADVLKSSPGNVAAAYNYEFVIRLRDTLARGRQAVPRARSETTIHGEMGGPPPGVDMGQFRMMVPRRSDERKEESEAGKSQRRVRKG